MKKFIVALLAVVMVFAFAACGEQEDTKASDEGLTAIPLGGSLDDYELNTEVFGTYVPVDFPEGTEPGEDVDAQLYYSEGSVTPYIAVYRWANEDGNTLEEEIASGTAEYGVKYTISSWDGFGTDEVGAYTAGYSFNDNYYYLAGNIIEDGDEFVEIDFLAATEEVQLGETDQYIWVPTGYTDMMTDEEASHGAVFWGEYSEDKFLPAIWVAEYTGSYEELEWNWKELYPDGLKFDEKTYNEWCAEAEKDGWTDELSQKYYSGLGGEFEKHEFTELDAENSISFYYYSYEDIGCVEVYFNIGDLCYVAGLVDHYAQMYADVIAKSLHTK